MSLVSLALKIQTGVIGYLQHSIAFLLSTEKGGNVSSRGDLIYISLPQESLSPLSLCGASLATPGHSEGLVASAGNGVFSIRFSSRFVIHD